VPVVEHSDISFDELSEQEQRAAIEAEIASVGDFGLDDSDYSHIEDDVTDKLRSGVEDI
jgi:hypothetical protein